MAIIIKSWKCVKYAHRFSYQESIGTRQVDSGHSSQQPQESKRKQTKVIVKEPDTAPILLRCGIKVDRSALVFVLKISEHFCTRAMDQSPSQFHLFTQNVNATDYWKLSEKLLLSYFPGPRFFPKRGLEKYESMTFEQRRLCSIGIGEELATGTTRIKKSIKKEAEKKFQRCQ